MSFIKFDNSIVNEFCIKFLLPVDKKPVIIGDAITYQIILVTTNDEKWSWDFDSAAHRDAKLDNLLSRLNEK